MKLSEPKIRLVIDNQKELSKKLFAFSWMNGELFEPFQELGKVAEQLEAEHDRLRQFIYHEDCHTSECDMWLEVDKDQACTCEWQRHSALLAEEQEDE